MARLLEASGHPYGTQELAYFVWELVPPGGEATVLDIEEALIRVLRSEHNHFARLWDDASPPQRLLMLALADEPARSIYSPLPQPPRATGNPDPASRLAGLVKKELVGPDHEGDYCVVEPFLAEWLRLEQARR